MQIVDIMTPGIESVTEEETVAAAAGRMRDANIGALPVTGAGHKLTGIITDRDIVVRAVANGRDPKSLKVRNAMTSGVVSCPGGNSVEDAVALMEKQQIRRLVVLDENNAAVGILALGDIAVKTPGQEVAGHAVEEISKPAQPQK